LDNLTHSLVGVLIARSVGKERFPQAAAICVVAANVPDIDIVTLYDPATYLTYHRHLTHALLAVPLMAALALALVAGWNRLRACEAGNIWQWRSWALALAAAASHVALDMTNSYGVRLWLPFSNEWSSWDVFFIIDLVLWGLLLFATLGPILWNRKMLTARLGIAALFAYAGLTLAIKSGVAANVQQTVDDDANAVVARLFPAPSTPWAWSVHRDLRDGESIAHWDGLADVQSSPITFLPVEPQVMDAVLATKLGRFYYDFARYPLFVMEGDSAVRLGDYRFIRGGELAFSCRFELHAGRVTNAVFEF
jgi:membrane-bound metal-dependent hydrolase YbcI (DUF457 family)